MEYRIHVGSGKLKTCSLYCKTVQIPYLQYSKALGERGMKEESLSQPWIHTTDNEAREESLAV